MDPATANNETGFQLGNETVSENGLEPENRPTSEVEAVTESISATTSHVESSPQGNRDVMDEIYDAEDSELSGDEEVEIDLESNLMVLLQHVEDCLDIDSNDTIPRVNVSPEFAKEVVDFLVSKGTLLFLSKYVLDPDNNYPATDLLAALGFPLPISVVENPNFSSQNFQIALQIAIKHTLSHRARLDSPRSVDDVVDAIKHAKNILVITGAGISTSLGIPDFRSDDGLYARLRHLGLGDPQEVFDIRLFREDPSIFYSVAANLLPREGLHSGTPTHKFIKMLHEHGKLLRNYTQNIDNLEQFVGIPQEKVVQCHGSIGSAHCITCGFSVPDGESLFPQIEKGEIPYCPECEQRQKQGKRTRKEDDDDVDSSSFGVLKPDITFFGESLPARFDHMLFDEGDAKNCDLILCMGTSLRVSPVSEIVKVVPRQVPQIYVSKTPAKHATFEVVFLGGCDDVVELLCSKLGWDLIHPMAKRPRDLADDRYPGGDIEEHDGVYTFVDANTTGEEGKLEEEKTKTEKTAIQ